VLVQLEEVARLNRIIDELLFLSRAEAQAIKIDGTPRAPDDFIENFRNDAQVLAEHHGRGFVLSHQGDGLVAFEERWMRQVLLNLLTNAINASPRGGLISVTSRLGNGRWLVSMEDQGPGLNPEQCELIFERFVRFQRPETIEDRGSGLGLAICRSIIALHHGRIFAEPREEGGLRVSFEMPAAL